jgi:hypothetical protein
VISGNLDDTSVIEEEAKKSDVVIRAFVLYFTRLAVILTIKFRCRK